MTEQTIHEGDRVKVIQVAFPNLPNHAKFLGKLGTVQKVFKTKDEVRVKFDDESLNVRYCYPPYLQKVN